MPAQRDRTGAPGGVTAAALSRRLGEAVSAKGNGNGYGRSNGKGAIETPSPRDVAIDVCRAILAEAGTWTAEHSDDVVLITEAIGERMDLAGPAAEDLLTAARLHDIGKAWIPSRILEKRGPLTDEEWALMRRHTVVGEEILSSVDELAQVGRLVRYSHERWDGRGYPDGLKGPDIPLGSRIIFCADAFHAIRSDRPYRAGRSAREAVAEIKRCAGSQFDPTVATALEEVVRERQRKPRGAGSSRLFALLMCLVIGGAGTAIARSDLLGEPDTPAPSSPAPIVPAVPPGPGPQAGTSDRGAVSGRPVQHRRRHDRGNSHRDTGSSTADSTGSEQAAKPADSTGSASGWHGSGKSGSAPGHTKPSGSPGPGKSGSAPGHTKPSGSSGPGKSGTAPGHTKPTSGSGTSSSSNGGGSSNGNSGGSNGSQGSKK